MIVADDAALQFFRHCLAQFVEQDESALVGQPQIAREGQRGLALHFVAEDRNGRQIVPQGPLVAGKQRSRRDREILPQALQR